MRIINKNNKMKNILFFCLLLVSFFACSDGDYIEQEYAIDEISLKKGLTTLGDSYDDVLEEYPYATLWSYGIEKSMRINSYYNKELSITSFNFEKDICSSVDIAFYSNKEQIDNYLNHSKELIGKMGDAIDIVVSYKNLNYESISDKNVKVSLDKDVDIKSWLENNLAEDQLLDDIIFEWEYKSTKVKLLYIVDSNDTGVYTRIVLHIGNTYFGYGM